MELPEAKAPSLTTWSPEVNMLARVVDGLQAVVGAVVASTGTKPNKSEPVRRPESVLDKAMQDARTYARKAKHAAIVALVTRPGAPSMSDGDSGEATFTTPRHD